jgi:hypothetical protein
VIFQFLPNYFCQGVGYILKRFNKLLRSQVTFAAVCCLPANAFTGLLWFRRNQSIIRGLSFSPQKLTLFGVTAPRVQGKSRILRIHALRLENALNAADRTLISGDCTV